MAAEPENEPLPTSPSRSPSFKGRLKLDDFAYTDIKQSTRRSARLLGFPAPKGTRTAARADGESTAASASPSSSSTAGPSERKRRRAEDVVEDAAVDVVEKNGESKDATSLAPMFLKGAARSARSLAIMTKRQKTRAAAPSDGSGKNGSGYAPPSTYAHLSGVQDALVPGLLVMFVGLNPGVQTARTGHAYAHPTNLFWRLMHSSGMTTRLCAPSEHLDMPRLFQLGLTNIVARPSRNGAELAHRELDAGVAVLEAKARRFRPEAVCIVGKGIWESVWRVRHGRAIRKNEFSYGWQPAGENMGTAAGVAKALAAANSDDPSFLSSDLVDEGMEEVEGAADWGGARMFVATSTSGLAATLPLVEKERIWRELGVWVEQRRAERAAAAAAEA
ncbi:hypothetical protein RB595_003056 [Gaeumannomyces hyphopodioides]